jgi:hypothetical protein
MNISTDFIDNGIHYHHTWLPMDGLEDHVRSAGHEIVEDHEIWSGRAPGKPLYTIPVVGSDHIFVTKRKQHTNWNIVDGELVESEM